MRTNTSQFMKEAESVKPGIPSTTTIERKVILEKSDIFKIPVQQDFVEYTEPTIICKMPAPDDFVSESTTIYDCEMPVPETFEFKPTKVTKSFKCEYPSVDANVAHERQLLPFPEDLHELIAWTDAFVDRIAGMTVAKEQVSLHPVLGQICSKLDVDIVRRIPSKI